MKRLTLLNAVDELKDSDNMQHSIDELSTLCVEFCDHYETEFNGIKDMLEVLEPHIDKVHEAYEVAGKCSSDLY